MIKKNLLFILLLAGVIISTESCIENGGNKSFYNTLAVISEKSTAGVFMNTQEFPYYGPIAAPSLNNLNVGDCIYGSYLLDFDHQPTNEYLTATETNFQVVKKDAFFVSRGEMIDAYNDSIFSARIATAEYFNGNLFIETVPKGSVKEQYDFELVLNLDSISNGIHTAFLKSKKIDGSTHNSGLRFVAFDVNYAITAFGRDTVVNSQHFGILSLNLKYQIGENEGVPVYTQLDNKPVEIVVYR
jgi:hypothetical protein